MSTLSSPARFSIPVVESLTCLACGGLYAHRLGTHDPERCVACRQAEASAEGVKLIGQVRELVNGTGAFACLPLEDRREQLRELGILIEPARNAADAPDPITRQQIEDADEQQAREQAMAGDVDQFDTPFFS